MPNLLTPTFAALIAVLPALLAMWWARGLDRLTDDGALLERLLSNRTRNSVVTSACFMLLYMTAHSDGIWAFPLLLVSRVAVGYRLRQRLYDETWSIVEYASFYTRLAIAGFSFWFLLGALPWLVSLAGTRDWLVAGALAVVLLVASETYSLWFRAILRAHPVNDPAIASRFAALTSACTLPDAALAQVDVRGGMFVNAVALPSTRWPAVAVTSTLLERLDIDEVTAVLGHELAHLEHYTPRRLRRLSMISYGLIAVGALLTPVARVMMPQSAAALMYLWQIVVVGALVLRTKDQQANETSSDLRALALSGNADALARALTKIHAAGRIPRRWDVEWERHATHPSLARRIQAIHQAAGTPPASLGTDATFVGTDQLSSVTLYEDRVTWNEHGTASHTMPYRQLAMLRVDSKAPHAPRLVALDAAHRRWELPLNPADVSRAQATLDIVDTLLGAAVPRPAVSMILPRMIAIMAFSAAMSVQQLPAAIVMIAAGMLPALPLLGAAGAASIGAAVIVARDNGFSTSDVRPWIAGVLLVFGAALVAINVANRRERTDARATKLMWALAIWALVAWIGFALSCRSVIDAHRGGVAWPSAAILGLALGAGLAFTQRRVARYASVALIAASLAVIVVGSAAFRDLFVKDPFIVSTGTINVSVISAASAAEVTLPYDITTLWVSPQGSRIAFSSEDENEMITVHAGTPGGTLASFDATQAAFVDERGLLVLERQGETSRLRLVDLEDASRALWSHRLPLKYGRVSFEAASKDWHVSGWNGREIVSVAGRVGSDDVRVMSWDVSAIDRNDVDPLAVSTGSLLALETDYGYRSAVTSRLGVLSFMLPAPRARYRLIRLSPEGSSAIESRLDVTCSSLAPEGSKTMCASFDGTRTRFFAADAATGQLKPIGALTGRSNIYNNAGGGWVMGTIEREAVLIHASSREVLRVAASERPYEIAINERVVATVTSRSENNSTVRVYPRN